jgi:hypothetical protein
MKSLGGPVSLYVSYVIMHFIGCIRVELFYVVRGKCAILSRAHQIAMGKAFSVVGNACDEHGIISMVTVGAKNILVPVVRRWPMLQDEVARVHLVGQSSAVQALDFALQIGSEHSFCGFYHDVGGGEEDVIFDPCLSG